MSAPPQRFDSSQVVAVLLVGMVGVLIPGLQPQLLGALAQEGRLSVAALGGIATLELLTMGIAAGAAGAVLPLDRLRGVTVLAALATALLDGLTPLAAGAMLFVVRGAAGLGEGVLIWVTIGLIVRTASPGRWAGLYLMLQTLAQLALATLLGVWVLPHAGAAGGFVALAIVTLGALVAVPGVPRAYAALDDDGEARGLPPPRGIGALAAVALYLAFVVALWVYLEPLGQQRGLAPATVAIITPLALAMQVLGAGAATLLAGRIPALPVLLVVGAINLALLALLGTTVTPAVFVAASAAFGFFWLFVMPFQIPIVIAADPSRRAAALVGGAQLIGSSLGPFIAATLVGVADVRPILWFGTGCILASLVVSASVLLFPRTPQEPA